MATDWTIRANRERASHVPSGEGPCPYCGHELPAYECQARREQDGEFASTATLGLTGDEIDALVRVLRSVGGTPSTTGRGHIDSILAKLETVRPGCTDEAYPGDYDGTTTGSIYFTAQPAREEATP